MCHKILKMSESLVHSDCKARLHYVQGPVCYKCGKPILTDDEEYCSDCQSKKHKFESGHAIWLYDTAMKKSIANYKYHGQRAYADFYAKQMAAVQGAWIKALQPDVLIPVPIHWRKKNMRGFNQSELLAKRLGKLLNCPVDSRYLVRKKWTEPQKALTALQRYVNLKDAFKVKTKKKFYPIVLLVDDIYTTGSTIDACASVLKAAGTEKVYYISLCIGSDHGG